MSTEIDFTTKAQEMSYVIFRISFSIRRAEFRARIERATFDLFEAVALHDFAKALSFTAVLEGLVQIGVSLYEIETVNAQSLLHDLLAFQSAIRQKYSSGALPIADQSAIEKESVADYPAIWPALPNTASLGGQDPAIESANENDILEHVSEDGDDGMTSIASTIRQSAILDKVRNMTSREQSSFVSGCRMKDLLTAFPQVSERTLRYDLQNLLERGAVERLGSGGSNSFYVIK